MLNRFFIISFNDFISNGFFRFASAFDCENLASSSFKKLLVIITTLVFSKSFSDLMFSETV